MASPALLAGDTISDRPTYAPLTAPRKIWVNGLARTGSSFGNDCFDIRRDHVGIERSLVRPPLERQKAARLAYDFHQRVDQATWLRGRLFGEGYE